MVLFPCEYPSYMFKFSDGGVQLSRLHLREEGRRGGGGAFHFVEIFHLVEITSLLHVIEMLKKKIIEDD